MRITVLILGLLLGLLMFLQTIVVYALGSVGEQEDATSAAAVGLLMALFWLVACAFVLPFPMVSVLCFAVAGLLGFAMAAQFSDLGIWGGASLVLALFSFFGWLGKRRDTRRERLSEQALAERDTRMEAQLEAQLAAGRAAVTVECPSCHRRTPTGTKFCAECGARSAFPAYSPSA